MMVKERRQPVQRQIQTPGRDGPWFEELYQERSGCGVDEVSQLPIFFSLHFVKSAGDDNEDDEGDYDVQNMELLLYETGRCCLSRD